MKNTEDKNILEIKNEIDNELQRRYNRFDPLKIIADWKNADDIAYRIS